jgi:ribosomal-protein-alanine N-acetyltransferase
MFSVIKIAYKSLPEQYNPIIFNHFYETFPEGFIVAEKNHKLIGFIVGVKTVEGIAKIPLLAVAKHDRKQNVGSTLLMKLLEELAHQKINHVELEVRTTNIPAINFYTKHGFIITDRVLGFYQNGEDAYLMRKQI